MFVYASTQAARLKTIGDCFLVRQTNIAAVKRPAKTMCANSAQSD
jgi:hypothetical protein